MADIVVIVQGVKELNAKLDRLQRAQLLVAPMEIAVDRLKGFMNKYPVQRNANSTYVRTGTLGRRWTTRVTPSALAVTGKVGNNTIYGPWVQSAAFQAEIHRGHWQTDRDAIRVNRNAIIADFERSIRVELAR